MRQEQGIKRATCKNIHQKSPKCIDCANLKKTKPYTELPIKCAFAGILLLFPSC